MALEIRPAVPSEFAAVADLCAAAYAPFLGDDSEYAAVVRDVAGRAGAAEVLIAAEPGDLLGTVTFVPDGGPLGEIARPEETEFRMLAVAPAAHGRGVGTALLRHVVDESRRRGKEGVVCSSQPEMRAAHRVYARLGFAREPARDWSPMPGVDLLAFALSFRASRRSTPESAGSASPRTGSSRGSESPPARRARHARTGNGETHP